MSTIGRFPRDEDTLHDDAVVRVLDDEIEARAEDAERTLAKRADELSLQQAFMEGQLAGVKGRGHEMNPYSDPNCPEHHEWNRGRLGAMGHALARKIA